MWVLSVCSLPVLGQPNQQKTQASPPLVQNTHFRISAFRPNISTGKVHAPELWRNCARRGGGGCDRSEATERRERPRGVWANAGCASDPESMPGGVSAYLTFANANRNAVRDELLLAQGADGTGKIGIAQVSASEKKKRRC